MDVRNLYDYLLRAAIRKAALVLTFDDGDKYSLSSIDLCYSIDRDGQRENEPLDVSFDNCLTESNKRSQALREGRLKTPRVSWTSEEPIEPVGVSYGVDNVLTVWDEDRQYFVFDRGTSR